MEGPSFFAISEPFHGETEFSRGLEISLADVVLSGTVFICLRKFNFRPGKELHKELAIRAAANGESLNAYCRELVETALHT